jgi:hypothetical protein
MCESFNGWSNRETWATALHINNDAVLWETSVNYTRNVLARTPLLYPEERASYASAELADVLASWIQDDLLTPGNLAGNYQLWLMLTDIGSLYRVNWREIAEGYISEMQYQESEV